MLLPSGVLHASVSAVPDASVLLLSSPALGPSVLLLPLVVGASVLLLPPSVLYAAGVVEKLVFFSYDDLELTRC